MSRNGAEHDLPPWHEEADLVVIGSGAAGLTAALTALCENSSAIVLEKSPKVGGASAWSGGLLWVPMNPKAPPSENKDSREAALSYIVASAGQETDRDLVEAFVDHAAATIEFLEAHSALRFVNCPYPDSFVETAGGLPQGRHLEIAPFAMSKLGARESELLQPSRPNPFLTRDILEKKVLSNLRWALVRHFPLICWRLARGLRVGGVALMAGLFSACIERGCRIRPDHRVVEIVAAPGGAAIGVIAETPQGRRRFRARRGVILASGGFEWNAGLVSRYLPVPLHLLPTPERLAEGDNIALAERLGAELRHMNTYWHWPAVTPKGAIDGETRPGMLCFTERTMPHSIWVNRSGRRFTNEAAHNCALAFELRGEDGLLVNQPAWSIFDAQFAARYPIFSSVRSSRPDTPGLISAASLEELANKIGIPGGALVETVRRFNAHVAHGRDPDFGRGSHLYERAIGDRRAPNPTLGTIERPPFHAISVVASAVGTRGGPRTDIDGRILRRDATAIEGLYAAGNAAACFYGRNMIAGGATLMPAMVFARRAALHALQRRLS